MSRNTYELWKDDHGSVFLPRDHPQRHLMLSKGAKLVLSVEADSWEEAMQKKCEHEGEVYRPLED